MYTDFSKDEKKAERLFKKMNFEKENCLKNKFIKFWIRYVLCINEDRFKQKMIYKLFA